MHEYTFWQLVENNADWVSALAALAGVIAAVIFGIVSARIIAWQGYVMERQAETMDRQAAIMETQGNEAAALLRAQNLLIRWQHEHEWMVQCNKDREYIRSIVNEIQDNCETLTGQVTYDVGRWIKIDELATALREKLGILDLAVFDTPADQQWFPRLVNYLDELRGRATEYNVFHTKYGRGQSADQSATFSELLSKLNLKHQPTEIADLIESSVRVQFMEFKDKWDREFPKS